MKLSLYLRSVTDDERAALKSEMSSSDAFTVHRWQILLASAERRKPAEIERT
jgi:hypothetical protein